MACNTMEAFERVRQVDRAGKVAESPDDKKQETATTLLRDEISNTGTLQTYRYTCLQSLRTSQ